MVFSHATVNFWHLPPLPHTSHLWAMLVQWCVGLALATASLSGFAQSVPTRVSSTPGAVSTTATVTLQTSPTAPVHPQAASPPILTGLSQYWTDTSNSLTVQQVASDDTFIWNALPPNGIYPLRAHQSMWIRLSLPRAEKPETWLLEIPYPVLDQASLYSLGPSGQWSEQRAGDRTAVSQWPIPHRYPLLTVQQSADTHTHFLLRIENAQGFSAPLRLTNTPQLLRAEQRVSLFLGSYFGLALLGCLVGLLGSLYLRDIAYVYYGLSSTLMGLTQAAIVGFAGLYLWPDSPRWADRSLVILGCWMLMSTLLLNSTIVSLAQRSRRLNRLVWLVVALGALLSLALGLTDSAIRLALLIPYLVLNLLTMLLVNVWAWRHGDRFGGWLLLSATPFALGLMLAIARYLQWIAQSFATEQGVLASMALVLPSMLAVLVLRSKHRHENTRRIKGLDRMDPETGLVNDNVFLERLTGMQARADRLKHRGAVMLVDIVNTEQILRDFGRKAADELPLRVAQRLLSTARDIDSAARLSQRRFGMLVEGPFSAEDAATLGPRIVARCLMPYAGLHVDCVAHVHVVYALVPHQNLRAEQLLSKLADRLAAAAPDGKKAVFMLGDTARSKSPGNSQPPESA